MSRKTRPGPLTPDAGSARSRLLNEFQRDFPLERRPFERVGEEIGASEAQVLEELRALSEQGLVSRVGAVFAPGTVGTSTLAAVAVPDERLEEVAALVNSFPEVNHNYERENDLNLWFVVAADDEDQLACTLARIETAIGLPVHDLRLEREFRIDLSFDLEAPHLRKGNDPPEV